MKKRILTCVLAIAMLFACCFVVSEEALAAGQTVTVGATTRMEGYFFTDLWSANTADNDVRTLLHGYSTVVVSREGECELDKTAVTSMTAKTDAKGNRTYTFTINPNLKYSDGSALTARDYVFSVLLQAAPELRALGAAPAALDQLVGYEAYAAGETRAFAGVRLIDKRRFSLTVSGEYLPYFYELMYVNVTPYPMAVLAPGFDVKDSGEGAYIAYTGKPDADGHTPELGAVLEETVLGGGDGYLYFPQVTSGPYRLTACDRSSGEASFARNTYYLGNFEGAVPSISKLRFVNVSNEDALRRLKSGEIDILNKLTDGDVIDASGASGFRRVNYPRSGYGFMAFACEDAVTGSQSVRQAIALLTDADGFVKDFLGSHGQRVYGHYGRGQWMYINGKNMVADLPHYDFDAEGAAALLDADGWTLNEAGEAYSGEGVRFKRAQDGSLLKLELNWAALADNTGCQTLQAYTVEHLRDAGFAVNVVEMRFDEMLNAYYRRTDRRYNLFYLASNFSSVYDPYYIVSDDAAHQGVQNTTGIADAELMRLAKQLRTTVRGDAAAYIRRWSEFQHRYAELLPTYPLYSNSYCDVYSGRISNYYPEKHNSWAMAIVYAKL